MHPPESFTQRLPDTRKENLDSCLPSRQSLHVTGNQYAASDLPELPDLAARIAQDSRRLESADTEPLDAVRITRDIGRLSDTALRAAVDRARASGHTWQEISDVLGTSRQAAFQRFGKPIDPRTGEPMSQAMFPDAAERATGLMELWTAGQWDHTFAAAQPATESVTQSLTPQLLADAFAHIVSLVGAYQRMDEPAARLKGNLTVVDIPLLFEAGEMKGRVAYESDGRTAGLFILRPDAP